MRKRVDFFINYEHKARELEGDVLLKLELERRGYSVELCCTYDPRRGNIGKTVSPKVVVAPALYNNGCLDYFVYSLFGQVKKIANLQWEQVLSVRDELDKACYQNPKEYSRFALHLCWGKAVVERLVDAGVPEKQALIVGPLQMDLLRPAFCSKYVSKMELGPTFGLRPEAKWCLFVSSYTYVNMTVEEFDGELKRLGSELLDFQRVSVESKAKTLEWLECAARAFPDIEFIYRAHPSENADIKLAMLQKNIKNFHVINEYPIKQWILICDLQFTWYSTAIAEMFYAKKTCGILRPVPIPAPWEVVVYREAGLIEKRESFLDTLRSGVQEFPLKKNILNAYYEVDDARPSYIRIADELVRLLESDDLDMEEYESSVSIAARNSLRRIKTIIKRIAICFGYKWLACIDKGLVRRLDRNVAVAERLERDRSKNMATAAEMNALEAFFSPIINSQLAD